MSVSKTAFISVTVFSILMVAVIHGQQTASQKKFTESGEELFRIYCASCHGRAAKGDGPLADHMKKRPPDLTRFAEQNGGVFPSAKVTQIIDGRTPLAGHGGPDMPVWGNVFRASSQVGSEDAVKARIDALVKHLESIQQKNARVAPANEAGSGQ